MWAADAHSSADVKPEPPEGGWGVYRIEGGRARLTPVEVGHRGVSEAEVLKGAIARGWLAES
ncbi:MAG TPA: hypothetical protein PLA94_31880, partial [Myxococcota bacterium]|nr:hypothetical protein [Myxococcota bacterium]